MLLRALAEPENLVLRGPPQFLLVAGALNADAHAAVAFRMLLVATNLDGTACQHVDAQATKAMHHGAWLGDVPLLTLCCLHRAQPLRE